MGSAINFDSLLSQIRSANNTESDSISSKYAGSGNVYDSSQAQQQNGIDLSNFREANSLEGFLGNLYKTGETLTNLTGFNDAWSQYFHDDNGNFTFDKATPDKVAETAARFVTGLPGQMLGGIAMSAPQAAEALTGQNYMNTQEVDGRMFIDNAQLSDEQRLASAGNAFINGGLAFTGAGRIAAAPAQALLKNTFKGAGETLGQTIGKTAAIGALEEAPQEFTQGYLDVIRGDNGTGKSGFQAVADNPGRALQNATEGAVLGAIGGGVMGGAGGGLGHLVKTYNSNTSAKDDLVGDSAPTTAKSGFSSGSPSVGGRMIDPATKDLMEEVEDNRQAAATTAKLMDDATLKWSQMAVGIDQLRSSYFSEVNGKTGSSVMSNLLGYDKWAAANNAKFKSLDELMDRGIDQSESGRRKLDAEKIAAINAYLSSESASGRYVSGVIGKNPDNQLGLNRMQLSEVRSGGATWVHPSVAKALNSDFDGDALQLYLDDTNPLISGVTYGHTKLMSNLSEGKTRGGLNDMLQVYKGKGKRVDQTASELMSVLETRLGGKEAKRLSDMWKRIAEYLSLDKNARSAIESKLVNGESMVDDDVLMSGDAYKVDMFVDEVLKAFKDADPESRRLLADEVISVIQSIDNSATIPGVFNTASAQTADLAVSAAEEMVAAGSKAGGQNGTIGSAVEVLADAILQLGRHLSFGNLNSPAFFRQLQQLYQLNKGELMNYDGKGFAPESALKTWCAAFYHIFQFNKAPMDYMKGYLSAIVDVEVRGAMTDSVIGSEASYESVKAAFIKKYDEVVSIMEDVYKEQTPQDNKIPFGKVMPGKIGDSDTAFYSAWNRVYGSATVSSLFGDVGWMSSMTTSDILNYVGYDPMSAGSLFGKSFIADHFKNLAKAKKNEDMMVEREISSEIEGSYVQAVKNIWRNLSDGKILNEDAPYAAAVMSYMYRVLPKKVGIRMGFSDIDTVFSDESNEYARALVSENPEQIKNGLFSMMVRDTYSSVIDFAEQARSAKAKGDKEAYNSLMMKAAYAAESIQYTPLHKVITSMITMKVSAEEALSADSVDVGIEVLERLCDTSETFESKKETIVATGLGKAFNDSGIPILKWVLENSESSEETSGMTTRMSEAKNYLTGANRLNKAEQLKIVGKLDELNKVNNANIVDVIRSYKINRAGRLSSDMLASLVQESMFAGKNSADKGTSEPYATAVWAMCQLSKHGMTTSTVDQTTGTKFGKVRMSDLQNNPMLMSTLILEPDVEVTVIDDMTGDEMILNQEILFEGISSYNKNLGLTWEALSEFLKKNPNLVPVLSDLDMQIAPTGEARVSWAQSKDLHDSVVEHMKTDDVDMQESRMKDALFANVIDKPSGLFILASMIDLRGSSATDHVNLVRQVNKAKNDLYECFRYVASSADSATRQNRINEILNGITQNQIDLVKNSRNFAAVFNDWNSSAIDDALISRMHINISNSMNGELLSKYRIFQEEAEELFSVIDGIDQNADPKTVVSKLKSMSVKRRLKETKIRLDESESSFIDGLMNQGRDYRLGMIMSLMETLGERPTNIDLPNSYVFEGVEDLKEKLSDTKKKFEGFQNSEFVGGIVQDINAILVDLEKLGAKSDPYKYNSWSNNYDGSFRLNGMDNANISMLDGFPTLISRDQLSGYEDTSMASEYISKMIHEIADAYSWDISGEKMTSADEISKLDTVQRERLIRDWNRRVFKYYYSKAISSNPTDNTDSNFLESTVTAINTFEDMMMSYGDSKHIMSEFNSAVSSHQGRRGEVTKPNITFNFMDARNAFVANKMYSTGATGNVGIGVSQDNMMTRFLIGFSFLPRNIVCDNLDFQEVEVNSSNIDSMVNNKCWYSVDRSANTSPLTRAAVSKLQKDGVSRIYVINSETHSCCCAGCKHSSHNALGNDPSGYNALLSTIRDMLDACEPMHLKAKSHLDRAENLSRQVEMDKDIVSSSKLPALKGKVATADDLLAEFDSYRNKVVAKFDEMFLGDNSQFKSSFGFTHHESVVLANALNQVIEIKYSDGTYGKITRSELIRLSGETDPSKIYPEGKRPVSYRAVSMSLQQMSTIITNHVMSRFEQNGMKATREEFEEWGAEAAKTFGSWKPRSLSKDKVLGGVKPFNMFTGQNHPFNWTQSAATRFAESINANGIAREASLKASKVESISSYELEARKAGLKNILDDSYFGDDVMLGNVFGYSVYSKPNMSSGRSITPHNGDSSIKNLYDGNTWTINFCLSESAVSEAKSYLSGMPMHNWLLVTKDLATKFTYDSRFNQYETGSTIKAKNGMEFVIIQASPTSYFSDITSDIGKLEVSNVEDFENNVSVFLVSDDIDGIGDGAMHLINDDHHWDNKTYQKSGSKKFKVSNSHVFSASTWNNRVATSQHVNEEIGDLSNMSTSELVKYLNKMHVSLDDYKKSSEGNFTAENVAAAVRDYVEYATRTGNATRSGSVTRGQCIGLIRSEDLHGNVRYTPMIMTGIPVDVTVTNVSFDGLGNITANWIAEISALSKEIGSKIYCYPSYKAYAHAVSNVTAPAISSLGNVAKMRFNAVLSKEAFDSRAEDIDGDILRRNLYYAWRRSGGSIFGQFRRGANGNLEFQWNKEIQNGDLWDKANNRPETQLVEMMTANDFEGWKKFVADEKMTLFGYDETSSHSEKMRVKEVNDTVRTIASLAMAKKTPAIGYMFSSHQLSYDSNSNSVALGARYLNDYDPLVMYNRISDNGILAMFNAMNSDLCSSSEVESSDGKLFDRFGRILSEDGKRLQCMFMKPRFGDESGEFTVPTAEANLSMQHMIKQSYDHGANADSMKRMLMYHSLINGNQRQAVEYYVDKYNESVTRKFNGIEYDETYHESVPVLSKAYTSALMRDSLDIAEIGNSYLSDNRPILDQDGNVVANWENDQEMQTAVAAFNKALGIYDSSKAYSPYEIVNQFYKLLITYTKPTRGSGNNISFYMSDVIAGINTMTESINNNGLVVPGHIKRSMNDKYGDRFSMPIMPTEWAKTVFDNSQVLQNRWSTFAKFQDAMYNEYNDKIKDEVSRIKDDGKRRAILKQHAWIESKTGKDLNLGRVIGNTFLSDIIASDNLFLKVASAFPGLDEDVMRDICEKRQKKMRDLRGVYDARTINSRQTNPGSKIHMAANQETLIKCVRQLSSWNKFMALMNPLIAAGNITERAVYGNVMNGVLFFSGKLGIGPFSTGKAASSINDQFNLVKAISTEKNVVSFYSALRFLDLNGDFVNDVLTKGFRSSDEVFKYMETRKQELSFSERWQQEVMDVISGKDVMLSKQIQNFLNRFIQIASQRADEGDALCARLFEKSMPGSSKATYLEERLTSDDPASFLVEIMSPSSEYNDIALLASNWAKRGDMAQRSATGMVWSEIAANHPVFEFMLTTNVCRFVQYSTNMTERVLNFVAPMSSIRYLYTDMLSKFNGKVPGLNGVKFSDMHLEDAQMHKSLKEALAADAAHMSAGALAAVLLACSGVVEPPEDEKKWCNTDEWLIFGLRVKENWWLSDLIGPSIAMACTAKAAMLGKPRLDILGKKLGECLYNNPALKVGSLVTEILDPYSSAMDKFYADQESYGGLNQGNTTPLEMFASDAAVYGMNWLSSFLTPSIAKEIYQDAQQYEVSTKRVYKTNANGDIVYNDDGTADTVYTNYMDAKIRKLTKKNPVWAFIMNTVTGADDSGTGYFADEMPRTVYYDPAQMDSYERFSLMNEDGTPKSDQECQAIALQVIATLQSSSPDDLRASGFVLPYDTMKYVGDVVWDIAYGETELYKKFVDEGGMDYYVLGSGDYATGKASAEDIKSAYDADQTYWKDFYYNKLWSDEMKQGLTQYNRFNVSYEQDANGNWYASGFNKNPLLPIAVAQGSKNMAGETTGYSNDWATESAVTGTPMVDDNKNAMRAMTPIPIEYETPSWNSLGTSENNGYSKSYGTYSKSYGSSGGYSRSGGSGGKSYSSGGGSYSKQASYKSYTPGKMSTNNVMNPTRIQSTNLDYLRPNFETQGSRNAYRRSDY